MKKKYDALLQPIKINSMELKNRIVMSPVTTIYADENYGISPKMIDYFAERAKGGAAMVTTEAFYLDKSLTTGFSSVVLDRDTVIAGLSDLADAVHVYGSKLCVQIGAGSGRNELLATEDNPPVSASEVPAFANPNITCRALTIDEIQELVQRFGEAATRIKLSGADAINIHAHNGYIIDQFLSPAWNKREDQYGGSFENRMRFSVEILEAIRNAVGPDFPIIYRITLDHQFEGGRTIEESLEILKYLEGKGVDAFDIDAGAYESLDYIFTPYYLGDACELYVAPPVKKAGIKVPLLNAGAHTPETAAQAIEDGIIDIVQIGRGLLADPDFVLKLEKEQRERIRPCIRCNEDCTARIMGFRPASCTVNYQVGQEKRFEIHQAEEKKKVVVVGGGPAGLEAARVAALKGHDVTIFEKEADLGGLINYAATPDFKSQLKNLITWYRNELKELGVRIQLNTEVTADDDMLKKADNIIYAGGSKPIKPPIEGIDGENVLEILDAHQNLKDVTNKNIVIAGGGLSGCDFALELAQQGNHVSIVEMMDDIGGDLFFINRISLGRLIAKHGVNVLTGHKVTRFTDEGIEAEMVESKEKVTIPADLMVYSFGNKPFAELGKKLQQQYPGKVTIIGDAEKTGKVGNAIHSGFGAAFRIR